MVWEIWKQMMQIAGLQDESGKDLFKLHGLRHAAASLLIERGLPAFNLKAVIGHARVSTTYDIYGHLFPDDGRAREAINGIADEFVRDKNATC